MGQEITLYHGYDGCLPTSYTRNEKDWTQTRYNYMDFKKALEKAIELKERGLEVEMIVTVHATYIAVYFHIPPGINISTGPIHTAKLAGAV